MDWEKHIAQRSSFKGVTLDEGLRSYMLKVYNYMSLGLCATGIVSFLVAESPALKAFFFAPPLNFIVLLAPFILVMFFGIKIGTMKLSTAQTVFWIYSVLMGLCLSSIFDIYERGSIARVFFITAGTFAATSLYGYTTKRDLTSFGSFMFMGLIGIIIASIVNLFLASGPLYFAISVMGVIVFTGLTAWDTQRIKNFYTGDHTSEAAEKSAIMGALTLYLDFINLFLMLLRLLGQRR